MRRTLLFGGGVAVPPQLQRFHRGAAALGGVEHQRIEGGHDDLDLVGQVPDFARQGIVGGRVAPQPVAEQHVLEFLHEHGQDAVGVGDGERQPLRAAEPHEAVGQPVGVQPREDRHRRQRDGGHLQGEHQQRRDGGGVTRRTAR